MWATGTARQFPKPFWVKSGQLQQSPGFSRMKLMPTPTGYGEIVCPCCKTSLVIKQEFRLLVGQKFPGPGDAYATATKAKEADAKAKEDADANAKDNEETDVKAKEKAPEKEKEEAAKAKEQADAKAKEADAKAKAKKFEGPAPPPWREVSDTKELLPMQPVSRPPEHLLAKHLQTHPESGAFKVTGSPPEKKQRS
jgi:hypothetical protein